MAASNGHIAAAAPAPTSTEASSPAPMTTRADSMMVLQTATPCMDSDVSMDSAMRLYLIIWRLHLLPESAKNLSSKRVVKLAKKIVERVKGSLELSDISFRNAKAIVDIIRGELNSPSGSHSELRMLMDSMIVEQANEDQKAAAAEQKAEVQSECEYRAQVKAAAIVAAKPTAAGVWESASSGPAGRAASSTGSAPLRSDTRIAAGSVWPAAASGAAALPDPRVGVLSMYSAGLGQPSETITARHSPLRP